jgi:hypothetical protein
MPETSADIKKNTLTNCNGVFIFSNVYKRADYF